MMRRQSQDGFTLVEMIMVIVITGIIGGMVAVFLKAPIDQYMDVARRADMTDIADTALRRIGRDLRLALPNSVRVTVIGSNTYLEFLPTKGGGRYRAGAAPAGASAGCGSLGDDALDFTAADTCFEVLGPMPNMVAGATPDQVVVYNLGIPRPAACPAPLPAQCGSDAYQGDNRAAYSATNLSTITIAARQFPFDSPGRRFQVISRPVTYVCEPAPNGINGTLTRYWGYPIQSAQPTALGTLTSVNPGAMLAGNVSNCRFAYDAAVVAQRSGLVTMNLGITESGDTVTLYGATHVSNEP